MTISDPIYSKEKIRTEKYSKYPEKFIYIVKKESSTVSRITIKTC